jgi:flagellar basal-body rod modification protein FlgD
VNGVTDVGSGGSYTGSQTSNSSGVMGKDDFLNLLVTQLANQDPLNPMDSQQFASQLAEFSSLEQMSNMNSSLEQGLQADLAVAGALQNGLAAGLIGRSIIAVDDRMDLAGNGATISWESNEVPANLQIEVRNEIGSVMHTISLENPEGDTYTWDGKDANGSSLPEGVYYLNMVAQDLAGNDVAIRPLFMGQVDSVRYRMGEAWLVSGDLEIAMANVSEVRDSLPQQESDSNDAQSVDIFGNPVSDSDLNFD